MNIFLTGYRCTGKTSVGKKIAGKSKLDFIDADSLFVKETGMTISSFVAKEGWESFREKESLIIKKLCAFDRHVIATGGGVILDRNNVKHMKNSGMTVWLKAKPETIKKRIAEDENTEDQRPSLTSRGLIEEIEDTLLFRNPLYEEAMDFSVDTDDLKIDEICDIIINRIKMEK